MLNIGFVEIIRERYGDGWGAVKTGGEVQKMMTANHSAVIISILYF